MRLISFVFTFLPFATTCDTFPSFQSVVVVIVFEEAEPAVSTRVVAWLIQVYINLRVTEWPAATIARNHPRLACLGWHFSDQVYGEPWINLTLSIFETSHPKVLPVPFLSGQMKKKHHNNYASYQSIEQLSLNVLITNNFDIIDNSTEFFPFYCFTLKNHKV